MVTWATTLTFPAWHCAEHIVSTVSFTVPHISKIPICRRGNWSWKGVSTWGKESLYYLYHPAILAARQVKGASAREGPNTVPGLWWGINKWWLSLVLLLEQSKSMLLVPIRRISVSTCPSWEHGLSFLFPPFGGVGRRGLYLIGN